MGNLGRDDVWHKGTIGLHDKKTDEKTAGQRRQETSGNGAYGMTRRGKARQDAAADAA